MAVFLDPVLAPPTGPQQFLSRRAALDPWGSLPIRIPVKLESEKGKPAFHTRMKAAEPENLSLFRRDFQSEFVQPFGQGP